MGPLSASSASRQPKGRTRRTAILQAAEDVFAEKGYDRARLEDVAQRVGVRRASLVYYFKDKSALYTAVLDDLLTDLFGRYQRALGGSGPIGQRLEQTVDVWVDFIHGRPGLLRIMLREMADGVSEHSRPLADRMLPSAIAIGTAINEGRAARTLREIEPFHLMTTLTGASAFLLLSATIVAPPAGNEFSRDVTVEQHRELLKTIMRRLLGTSGPHRSPRRSISGKEGRE